MSKRIVKLGKQEPRPDKWAYDLAMGSLGVVLSAQLSSDSIWERVRGIERSVESWEPGLIERRVDDAQSS